MIGTGMKARGKAGGAVRAKVERLKRRKGRGSDTAEGIAPKPDHLKEGERMHFGERAAFAKGRARGIQKHRRHVRLMLTSISPEPWKACNWSIFRMEAEAGIEPANGSFADFCLTTWLLRRLRGG
jgi:hypothetical protein